MVDQLIETGTVGLESTIVGFSRNLRKDLNERGIVNLDELMERVYHWENIHGEKLSEEEFEVLSLLSMVLGTTKMVLDKSVGVKKGEVAKSAFLESAAAQQEIVKTVLGNLNESGRPAKSVVRSFALIANIFEDYFNPESPRLETPGAQREAGLWQGIQGMMTTVFLFRKAGWEIRLPPPELDVDFDVDLMVRNPAGEVFAVDITAKMPHIIDAKGTLSEPFFARLTPPSASYPPTLANSVNGTIKLNVPPLKHHSSWAFYEDRVSGFPSEKAVNDFKRQLRI